MRTLAIVGRGPSLERKRYGSEIDSYNHVIRCKTANNLRADIEGEKCTLLSISILVAAKYLTKNGSPNLPVIVMADSRYKMFGKNLFESGASGYGITVDNLLSNLFMQKNMVFNPDRCLSYLRKYQQAKDRFPVETDFDLRQVHGPYSDERGHNHPSIGFLTICYVMDMIKGMLNDIHLYGFDNLYTGKFDISITRGAEWNQYPDHRWDIEAALIREIAAENKINLEFHT